MKKDLEVFNYLLLVAAAVLVIMGVVLLVYILKPANRNIESSPETTIQESQFDLTEQSTTGSKEYFVNQNLFWEKGFDFYLYYPEKWFVSDNGGYSKDEFINTNEAEVISGWIISTFNNPDYQIGKQAALIIKVFNNHDNLDVVEWLKKHNQNLSSGLGSIISFALEEKSFYQVVDLENQVYIQLPSQEILVLTAPCGQNSRCVGDKEGNQEIFENILASLSFGQPTE